MTEASEDEESSRARTNLWAPASSFVGRAHELETLERFFDASRLVTLLGPGGMGKTRLALRCAEERRPAFAAHGGVWFVDLCDVRSVGGALVAVAGVLGFELGGLSSDEAISEAIGEGLARLGPVFLVLDNYEQLVASAHDTVGRWVRAAPSARFLVTSRVALALEGEQVLTLGPMSPVDAAELFNGRARSVRGDSTDENPTVVADIVEAIDRMPLAIELAASRTRVLSGADLRDRLARPLAVLQHGARPEERHGSVRRVLSDSVDLLPESARCAFVLASALRNGFTLEDAEAILGGHALRREDVLDALETLARSSLLRVHVEPGHPARYAYFEIIRELACELAEDHPALDAVRAAHAAHFAEVARSGTWGGAELENLLLAHETCIRLARSDEAFVEHALHIAIGLEPTLAARGLSQLRARLFDETLATLTDHAHDDAWIRAHLGRGLARRELGEITDAAADFEGALAAARDAGLDGLCAVALTHLADIRDVVGDTEGARARCDEALKLLARSEHDATREAREADVYLLLGHAHRREGRLAEAAAATARAAEGYRALGRDDGLARAGYERGVVALFAGRWEEASGRFEEALEVARRSAVRFMEGTILSGQGCLLQERGEPAAALDLHAEAVRVLAEVGTRYREASALYYLATAYVELGEADEALALLAQARKQVATVRSAHYEALIAGCRATALALLGLETAYDELAVAEEALARISSEPSLALTVRLHRGIVEARLNSASAREDVEALVERDLNDDARFALRVLRSVGRTHPSAHDALRVWPAASAFALPGGDPVRLPDASPLRGILSALIDLRIESPGEGLSIDAVIGAGWPEERIGAEAALNRAHVALTTLRKKGLRALIVRMGGGYAISPSVPVRKLEGELR